MTGIATKGSGMAETITVTDGGNTSIQDLGRLRASRIGQLTGGALDQYSAEVATALVGAPRTAPLLELVALGFGAVASADLLIAITGARQMSALPASHARNGNRSCGRQAENSPSEEYTTGCGSTSPSTDQSGPTPSWAAAHPIPFSDSADI